MLNQLKIRPVVKDDAHFINRYWEETTDEDLVRMGELTRPDPKSNIEFIEWFCSQSFVPKTNEEDLRIWCVDNKSVGYSTLKEIRYGNEAQIHLHLTRPYWLKGLGSVMFCMSALDFLNTYNLKRLYCQPKSDNPMPNGMLQKIGFRFLGRVDFSRKDGSIIKQNRYLIDQNTIDIYLEKAKLRFQF